MSKLYLLSSKFPPLNDGFSDHTFHMLNSLRKNIEVEVITTKSLERIEDKSVHYIVDKWKFLSLKRNLDGVFKEGDQLLVQYVPFMYGRKGGINFSIIIYFLYLKFFKNLKIHFFCHELHYPFLPDLKSLVMAFSHYFMLVGLTLSADKIFTSCERYKNHINNLTFFPLKRIIALTVGSNIDIELIIENQESGEIPKIGFFGSMHPSKGGAELLNLCVQAVEKSGRRAELIYIGLNQSEIDKLLTEKNKGKIKGLGKLDAKDVALELNTFDLGLNTLVTVLQHEEAQQLLFSNMVYPY